MRLHLVQEKLLKFFDSEDNCGSLSFRAIGSRIGVRHPERVKHHMIQLEKKGYIRRNEKGEMVVLKQPIEDVVYVPFWGFAYCGKAGSHRRVVHPRVEEHIPISTRVHSIVDPKNLVMVKAKGVSMEPKINNNDLVLIETDSKVKSGTIGLVRHKGKFRIKRIVIVGRNKYILESINTSLDYKSEIVSKNSGFVVVGRVRGLISSFN